MMLSGHRRRGPNCLLTLDLNVLAYARADTHNPCYNPGRTTSAEVGLSLVNNMRVVVCGGL